MKLIQRRAPRLAVLTMLVVAASQLVFQPAAHALAFVSCKHGTGEMSATPAFSTLPGVITVNGTTLYGPGKCSGGNGITAASVVFTGAVVGGTCVPVTNTILGTFNAGTATVTWTGGSGDPTTTFGWTIPAGLQVGPNTSVVVLVGFSQAGRFHIPLLPAITQLTVSFVNLTPTCTLLGPGANHADIVNASVKVLDIA